MSRNWLIIACAFGSLAFMRADATERTPQPASPAQAPAPAATAEARAEVRRAGIWQPPPGSRQIPIWPNGAPDMAGVSQPPESVLTAQTPDAIGGSISEAVFDVTAPTMTIFPPRGRNTGAAMIVFPGGGFRAVVITLEGTEICNWITAQGITCILLKYRVPWSDNRDHHWDDECRRQATPCIPRPFQDAQRTIRLVRSRAADLHIDPNRIGVIGFSAGGYLVAQTSNIFESAYTPVDAIDRISSRPDFAIAVFPGHLCRAGAMLDPGIHVTGRTPPTFLLQAWDDPVDDICNSTVYASALEAAGVAAEVHLFARGGHAFALRRTGHSVDRWPALVESWLGEIGVLAPLSTGR